MWSCATLFRGRLWRCTYKRKHTKRCHRKTTPKNATLNHTILNCEPTVCRWLWKHHFSLPQWSEKNHSHWSDMPGQQVCKSWCKVHDETLDKLQVRSLVELNRYFANCKKSCPKFQQVSEHPSSPLYLNQAKAYTRLVVLGYVLRSSIENLEWALRGVLIQEGVSGCRSLSAYYICMQHTACLAKSVTNLSTLHLVFESLA